MSIEFKNVSADPLTGFRAVAPSGAIIGVIGEKGSGVTELLKLACGILKPAEGEVIAEPERRFVALGEILNLAPAAALGDHRVAGVARRPSARNALRRSVVAGSGSPGREGRPARDAAEI